MLNLFGTANLIFYFLELQNEKAVNLIQKVRLFIFGPFFVK